MFKMPNGFDPAPYFIICFLAFLFYWFFPSHIAQRLPRVVYYRTTIVHPTPPTAPAPADKPATPALTAPPNP